MDIQFVNIHGHDVAYRTAGSGATVLVFVHGIAGSSATWVPVMERLDPDSYTMIAPDLLGHGESAKPRGDYSLGAYASGIRDLMVVLGLEAATFIGHSLGGGIAMQLAYQFPERCERLVLTCSGGLGKEVNPLLRVISAPGSEYLLPLVLTRRIHGAAGAVGRFLGKFGLRGDPSLGEIWDSYTRLTDARTQRAFVHTIRAVIDVAGQRVSARDRLYLAAAVPTMIIWGTRDRVIPVTHAYAAHELMPASRLEIIEGAGHFVPIEQPTVVADLLRDFLEGTEPAQISLRDLSDAVSSVSTGSEAMLHH